MLPSSALQGKADKSMLEFNDDSSHVLPIVRTELICPRCKAYDRFMSLTLASLGTFYELGLATVYKCANCDSCILPDDEFSAHDQPDVILCWSSLEEALRVLVQLDALLASVKRYSALNHRISTRMGNEIIHLIVSELEKLDPERQGQVEVVENDDLTKAIYRRNCLFLTAESDEYIMHIKSIAVVYQDSPRSLCFMVEYFPVSAALFGGSENMQVDQSRLFLDNFVLAAEPLLRLRPHSMKEFLRLTLAPSEFLSSIFRASARMLLEESGNDIAWRGM